MNYFEWEKSVPEEIMNDPLWSMKVYRLALFANYIGWYDVTKLMKDKRTISLSDHEEDGIYSAQETFKEDLDDLLTNVPLP